MTIRESTEQDEPALLSLHEAAFGSSEGPEIGRLVTALLHDDTARPLLSLVAERQGKPVGHAIFSAVSIEGHPGASVRILAPLAVAPGLQRRGTGGALITEGFARLAAAGVDCVLVLGDPRYYARAGFRADHAITAPHPLEHPEAWMANELASGVLERLAGRARCAASLEAPEYW
ncbi:GNAT family N-acetyltransferase [Halomonas sp. THAF12]|uniref:GNAT family N-acetyltransferase n=1 Tax=Halomonas sp. B23F22_10 TaxID=3459515 RepID=UPI00373F2249